MTPRNSKHRILGKVYLTICVFIILTVFAVLAVVFLRNKNPDDITQYFISKIARKSIKTDKRLVSTDKQFLVEIYNLIKNNYWDKATDDAVLSNLYLLAVQKLAPGSYTLVSTDQIGVENVINDATKTMDYERKVMFIAQVSDLVLQNLRPFGRSRLYGAKLVADLTNEVKNTEPDVNLYSNLGVGNSASQSEIDTAYQDKITDLKLQKQTPEIQKKIQDVQQAYDTIGNSEARKTYNDSGVQSTVSSKLINPRIFYMHLTRFSPTSLQDINRAVEGVDKGAELDTLIFDLRDNIGGLVDGLPYFLGPFIGPDQYAYQLFARGEKTDVKTKLGWLPAFVRYKKVIVLINKGCQSSTEVFASTLKKYNVGVLVGTKTNGWGTIEKIEQLLTQPDPKEKYSVILVEQLTLREDGQPIEGLGIEPNIDITDQEWETQLYKRFNSQEIVDSVKELLQPELDQLTTK